MVHRGHAFFLSCCGLVLTLFLWYDFGPVETVKNVYVFVSNTKNLQLPASAHEGMEELQDDYLERGAKKTEFNKNEPRSQPEIADQPAALSEPTKPTPSQALGRGLASIIRHQPSYMCINRLHPEGNSVVCCVCVGGSLPLC